MDFSAYDAEKIIMLRMFYVLRFGFSINKYNIYQYLTEHISFTAK